MKVFVAGGSGTIGMPLVRALVEAGHHVTALTRSPEKQQILRTLGATPAVADALDGAALRRVVLASRPSHVIHQLTALPKDGVRRASDLVATNRLRVEGTRNLLDAAIAAGATRVIGGSFAPLAGVHQDGPAGVRDTAAAIMSMESQILEASRTRRIDGIVLRYGLFYSADNPATQKMMRMVRRRLLPVVRGDLSLLPWIHVSDAVSATVAALERGVVGAVYDIVDDRPASMTEVVRALAEYAGVPPPLSVPAWVLRLFAPYLARILSMRLPLSNERARIDLDWRPAFPTIREGLMRIAARAA